MPERLTPQRELGATGVKVPLIGYGTAPLGKTDKIPMEQGIACLHRAIDLGITYLDTSPDYGSEPVLGEVMPARRGEVFLATKINNRSRDGVRRELEQSLEKLKTDHVDLIQVHAVNAWADLEMVLAPDGALPALEQARAEGLVRYIGITGHARPEILGHALRQYAFDTVLVALGMADRLVTSPETFCLPIAEERNVGVIAMKVFGHGEFQDRELALRYSLALPGVSLAILGMDSIKHIEENVALAGAFRPLEEQEEAKLIEMIRPVVDRDGEQQQQGQKSPLFWLHDTAVMGWRQHDEPQFVRY
jgi:aryl-alcohol dehydrogenase-like predicted oxidoreductase